MRIRFTKGDNKPDTLSCLRDDGSTTWSSLHPGFIYHDLTHYVVETTLGYREAFYGLVASGRDIDSFGTKNGVKDPLPLEAGYAEFVVGLVQMNARSGELENEEDFFTMLKLALANFELEPPPLTPAQLQQIRQETAALYSRWDEVASGKSLELPFPRP